MNEELRFTEKRDWPKSQVQAINEPPPKTWDDYRRGCIGTYRGGHSGDNADAFIHGMETVFNLLMHEFPAAEDIHRQVAELAELAEQRETLDKLPKCWQLKAGKLLKDCPVVPGMTVFVRVGINTLSGMLSGVTGEINSHLVGSVYKENISITRKGYYCCVAAADCANSPEAAAALAERSDDA